MLATRTSQVPVRLTYRVGAPRFGELQCSLGNRDGLGRITAKAAVPGCDDAHDRPAGLRRGQCQGHRLRLTGFKGADNDLKGISLALVDERRVKVGPNLDVGSRAGAGIAHRDFEDERVAGCGGARPFDADAHLRRRHAGCRLTLGAKAVAGLSARRRGHDAGAQRAEHRL